MRPLVGKWPGRSLGGDARRVAGSALRPGTDTLIGVLAQLGLTNGLQFANHAGDPNSYPGSGQSWLDTSGNGQDFFLGADVNASTDDPTFNSTGRASFFSADGGDFFRYDSANEAWMQTLHKDNAAFSGAFWVQQVSANFQGIFGTLGAISGRTGVFLRQETSNQINFRCVNAGTTAASLTTTATLVADTWSFVGITLNEATGSGGAVIQINATQQAFTSTYTNPASGDASATLELMTQGNGTGAMANTGRMGLASMWNVAKGAGDLMAIYSATRGWYGV